MNNFPPNMHENCKVIVFDGVCKFCNACSQFIIKYDKHEIFKLASMQSLEGQQILNYFNLPTDHFDTFLYIEGNRCFTKSDAFIEIMNHLGQPWRLLAVIRYLPRGFRNGCYQKIAMNRYSLLGKYQQCLVPSPEYENRFLKAKK